MVILLTTKEKVENFDDNKVEKKVVGKKGGKRSWSEEKEQEERSKGDESTASDKVEVPPVFGSMDIREKQKERKRIEEETEGGKVNPVDGRSV